METKVSIAVPLKVNDKLEITTDHGWPLAVMYFGHGSREKAEAYATLFAAAPALLEALEAYRTGRPYANGFVDALIAKAKGE